MTSHLVYNTQHGCAQLLFVTSTMVFAYSPLRLIVCIYRNSAIFVSEK